MWRALFSLAFFAGLRCVEYVGQNESSATLVNQVQFSHHPVKVMHFKVNQTKTTVHGYTIPLGCSGTQVCALCDMVEYIKVRYTNKQMGTEDKLFVYSNGVTVNKNQVNAMVKMLVKHMGLDPNDYSAHSIRAGAATTAAENGFAEWEIMRIGGWRSATYRQYIRNLDNHVAGFSARLAASQ